MIKVFMNNPPDNVKSELAAFLNSISADLNLSESSDNADLIIDFPEDKEICKKNHFHYGGRISCPEAFLAAEILGISKPNLGKLANMLNIKIFGCQLGCFK